MVRIPQQAGKIIAPSVWLKICIWDFFYIPVEPWSSLATLTGGETNRTPSYGSFRVIVANLWGCAFVHCEHRKRFAGARNMSWLPCVVSFLHTFLDNQPEIVSANLSWSFAAFIMRMKELRAQFNGNTLAAWFGVTACRARCPMWFPTVSKQTMQWWPRRVLDITHSVRHFQIVISN